MPSPPHRVCDEEDLPFGPSTLPFWEENEVLYINLLNYMRNNDNADFATLSFPQNPLSDKKWNQYKEKPPDYIQQRQPYEDLFSKVGLTLHQSVLHGGIYNVRNFSTLPDLDDAKEVDMVSNNLGSAGHAETHLYYRQLLENQDQNLFKAPAGSGLPHNIWYDQYGIPNSYKLHYANINGVGQLQPNFVSAFQDQIKHNAFLFFNFNTTVKIEYFKGTDFAKNDELSWEILRGENISNLGSNQKLFCRMRIWRPELIGEIKLPILDQYFLIYKNAGTGIPDYSPIMLIEDPLVSDEEAGKKYGDWHTDHIKHEQEPIEFFDGGGLDLPLQDQNPPAPMPPADNKQAADGQELLSAGTKAKVEFEFDQSPAADMPDAIDPTGTGPFDQGYQ